MDLQELQKIVYEAGIVGAGGAGFPTHVKLAANTIDTLLINGAECEPYLTTDCREMLECSDTIISGIPVTFSGQEVLREDQGLVIKGGYTDMVSVHFYGKNTDLKKLEQYKDEISAVVDVSKVRSAKEYQMSYQLTLPNAVQASAVQATDRNPSVITIEVEKLLRREIEVRGDFSGVEVAEGYLLESTNFDYDTVTVEGPESVVSTIDCAQIVMNRTNVDKNITENVE